MHDNTLTNDNRDKFIYLAGQYNQLVKFYNVEELCKEQVSFLREKLADKINSRFSIGTFYSLLIKDILGTGKVIYLDSDIIVNLDLDELWHQNVSDFPLAAVPEIDATLNCMITDKFLLHKEIVKLENYFCAGVMLFNLDKIYKNFFYEGVQFLADNPACESVDQDIFNAFFSTNYLKLEQKFDSFTAVERIRNSPVAKKIYHYAGQSIGLKIDEPYNRLWMSYFVKTPWFNAETLSNLYEKFSIMIQDIYSERNQSMINLSAAMSEKTRAFFVLKSDLNKLVEKFSVKSGEDILIVEPGAPLQNLIDLIKTSRDEKFFFIMLPNFPFQILIQEGLVKGKDFLNGVEFLSEAHGVPLNSYEFVKAM